MQRAGIDPRAGEPRGFENLGRQWFPESTESIGTSVRGGGSCDGGRRDSSPISTAINRIPSNDSANASMNPREQARDIRAGSDTLPFQSRGMSVRIGANL